MQLTDPAFPRITDIDVDANQGKAKITGTDGVAIIDYYAAQAMAAYIISLQISSAADFSKRAIPMHAFHMAKNMIEERKKYAEPVE